MSTITSPVRTPRRIRRFLSTVMATVLLGAVGTVLGLSAPVAAATASAAVSAQPEAAAPGATVTVSGVNFPPSSNVQVQICGNEALDGSADCDLTTSQEVATTPSGQFSLQLVISTPPKPCPCVVMALDFSLTITPTTPFDVIGAPVGSVSTLKIHKLKILSASLRGDGPWTSWFGTSPKRILVLTVHNPNSVAYAFPPLVLAIGQRKDTTTREATNHSLATIGPFKTETYDVPVSFPVVSIGEHQVNGILGNAGYTTQFEVKTWLFPWGLLLVALIVLQIIALLITRAIRERRRRKHAADGEAPPADPAEVPAEEAESVAPVG
jgi:hypothetical protein